MMIEITIATIGRLMKNFAIGMRTEFVRTRIRPASRHPTFSSGWSWNGLGSTVIAGFHFL